MTRNVQKHQRIPTFRQYDAAYRTEVSKRYGVSKAEINRLYGPDHYQREWWAHALKMYETGSAFTTQQWNQLAPYMQRQVLRSRRALRMSGNTPDPWKVEGEPA